MIQYHTIPPVFDKNSKILILGSMPSVKSREINFFYGNPQNRFWQVTAGVFNTVIPQTIPEKRAFLLSHNIALWDVIASCDIEGSSDSSIKDAKPNNIKRILDFCPIERIFVNGKTAEKLYNKLILPDISITASVLPSTSPANASYKLDDLINSWKIIL